MVIVEKCPQCQQLHAEGQLTCTQEPTEIEVIEEVAFSTAGAPPPAPRSDSLLHETLDERYRITRLLGSGGMGKVYAAEHLVTGKRFAIKVLNPQLANDEEARRRFAREARAI